MNYLKRKQLYSVKVVSNQSTVEGTIFVKARSVKKALKKIEKYGDYSVIEVKHEKRN